MNGRVTLSAAASLFLLGSVTTHAAEQGFYAGLTLGQADHDLSVFIEPGPGGNLSYDQSADSKDASFGLFGGYQFSRFFAVEGAFNHFGTSELDHSYRYQEPSIVLEGTGHADFESHALSIAALVSMPLGDSFSIGLRLGGAYWNADVDATDNVRFNGVAYPTGHSHVSDSDFGAVYGVNAEYALMPNLSLRADWQRFNDVGKGLESSDGFDIDLLSLSALWRF